jgi:hypothetical protein
MFDKELERQGMRLALKGGQTEPTTTIGNNQQFPANEKSEEKVLIEGPTRQWEYVVLVHLLRLKKWQLPKSQLPYYHHHHHHNYQHIKIVKCRPPQYPAIHQQHYLLLAHQPFPKDRAKLSHHQWPQAQCQPIKWPLQCYKILIMMNPKVIMIMV